VSTNEHKRPGPKPKVRLTDKQEQDLMDMYLHTDRPLAEIGRLMGVRDTAVYRYLANHGITWRRGDGTPYVTDIPGLPATEEMWTEVSPEEVTQPDFLQPGDGQLDEWLVTLTESFPVMARSIEGALDAARKSRPHSRITAVRLANT
jgi:hypothetical protein